MESVALIFNSITMMFILMVIGYILKKAAIITDGGIKDITDLLLYFVIPSIIVNSFAESYSEEKAQSIIICFILAICIHLLFGFMSNFIFKDPIDKNAAILTNCGFMGIPLVSSVFNEEAVFYVVPFMTVNAITQWTYGSYLLDKKKKMSIKNILLSPAIIAFVIGAALFFLNISVPLQISKVMDAIGALNTPLAMIVLGSYFTRIKITDIKKYLTKIFKLSITRLVIFPAVCLIIMCFIGGKDIIKLLSVNLILASCPSGLTVAFFTEKYTLDTVYATILVCITTLLSLFTMPMYLHLFTLLMK